MSPNHQELGVVYASVEGVDAASFDEGLHALKQKAAQLGATALVGLQLVQSQFQWNQRTSLLATAIAPAAKTLRPRSTAGANQRPGQARQLAGADGRLCREWGMSKGPLFTGFLRRGRRGP
jgi:hypothetical protein